LTTSTKPSMIVQTVACNTHPSRMLGPIAARLVHALTTLGGLLNFLQPCHSASLPFVSSTPARTGPPVISLPLASFPPPHPHAPLAGTVDLRVPPEELALECDEEDVLSAGMANFRCREFARAAHTLSACGSTRGRFLWLYSQYLVRHVSVLERVAGVIRPLQGQREDCSPRLE
jgi:hypothetical protein